MSEPSAMNAEVEWRHVAPEFAPTPIFIGVLTLAVDWVFEAEMRHILAPYTLLPANGTHPRCVLATARMPMPETCTPETLKTLADKMQGAARSIFPFTDPERSRIDALLFGCTTGSIAVGEDKVDALLSDVKQGAKVVQIVTSVREALRALGAKRIAVLTPYIPSVNETVDTFLASIGVVPVARGYFGIDNDHELNRISSVRAAALDLVRSAPSPAVDALFISCTGLLAASITAELEQTLGVPVISSNVATAWYLLDGLGLRASDEKQLATSYGRLFLLPVPLPADLTAAQCPAPSAGALEGVNTVADELNVKAPCKVQRRA